MYRETPSTIVYDSIIVMDYHWNGCKYYVCDVILSSLTLTAEAKKIIYEVLFVQIVQD